MNKLGFCKVVKLKKLNYDRPKSVKLCLNHLLLFYYSSTKNDPLNK